MKRTTKKRPSRKTLAERWRAVPYGRRVGVVLGVLVLIAVGYGWYHNWQAAEYNRQSKVFAEQSSKAIVEWFNLPAELVYEKVIDQGCGRDTTSWLGIYRSCGYRFVKIYKGSGSAEANIRAADKMLEEHSWVGGRSDEGLDYVATHRETTGIGYLYKDVGKQPRINLNFLTLDDPRQLYTAASVKDYLSNNYGLRGSEVPDVMLQGDEYLLGIWGVTGYRQ